MPSRVMWCQRVGGNEFWAEPRESSSWP